MTGGRNALKEAPRLLFRLLGFGRKIKGDECVIRKQVPEGRGLAGLSGSGQDDHRSRLRRPFQVSLSIARNPHICKIYDVIAYFA